MPDQPGDVGEDPRIRQIIEDFQAGRDRDRNFELLVACYSRQVLGFFRKRVSPEDRGDLTQETFLRVYKGLDGFRHEAPFAVFLFRIAHNVFLRWRRKQTAQQDTRPEGVAPSEDEAGAWEDGEAVAVDGGDSPLDELLERERNQLLRQAIAELPPQMRRCMVLRVHHDLSYREIAAVLHISIQTVKVHLFQARRRLGEALAPVFEEVDF